MYSKEDGGLAGPGGLKFEECTPAMVSYSDEIEIEIVVASFVITPAAELKRKSSNAEASVNSSLANVQRHAVAIFTEGWAKCSSATRKCTLFQNTETARQ